MVIRLSFVSVLCLVGGCVSMLTHNSYPDDQIIDNAENIAAIDFCVEKSFTSAEKVNSFKAAFAQLLEVSVYNKLLFTDSYNKEKRFLVSVSGNTLYNRKCSEFEDYLPKAIEKVGQRYNEIAAQRRSDISQMVSGVNSYQSPSYVGSNYFGSFRGTQPNFGVNQPSTSSYLVNTSSGFRQCTITSGVAMCN